MDKYEQDRRADEYVQDLLDNDIIKQAVPYIASSKSENKPDEAMILKMMEDPKTKFSWTEKGELIISYTDEDGDFVEKYVDTGNEDLKEIQDSVCDALPNCPFDINQGNVKSKQIEAKALYVMTILTAICPEIWLEEFKDGLKRIDFDTMKDDSGKMVFKPMLEDATMETNRLLDFVVASCYLKLTASELKKDQPLKDLVGKRAALKLDEMDTLILNETVKEREIMTEKEPKYKKWERGQASDLYNAKVAAIVDKFEESEQILWRIFQQTTDVVPLQLSLACGRLADVEVDKLAAKGLFNDDMERRSLRSKLKRRAKREALRQIKANQIKRWEQNDFDDLFPKI